MEFIIAKDYQDMSYKASEIVINTVTQKPNAVLGLATGSTVMGTYKHLIESFKKTRVSFENAYSVNLDEYIGLPYDHEQSYYTFMKKHFFDYIDLPKEHQNLPNGSAKNLKKECKRYEDMINLLGGVDIQLLGIGVNGHIGFNEPGTSFNSNTHVVELSPSTIEANSRFFTSIDQVPSRAITTGINTIMKSKKIILLVSGLQKSKILHDFCLSEITERIPATILKKHHDVTIIADEKAASLVNLLVEG